MRPGNDLNMSWAGFLKRFFAVLGLGLGLLLSLVVLMNPFGNLPVRAIEFKLGNAAASWQRVTDGLRFFAANDAASGLARGLAMASIIQLRHGDPLFGTRLAASGSGSPRNSPKKRRADNSSCLNVSATVVDFGCGR